MVAFAQDGDTEALNMSLPSKAHALMAEHIGRMALHTSPSRDMTGLEKTAPAKASVEEDLDSILTEAPPLAPRSN